MKKIKILKFLADIIYPLKCPICDNIVYPFGEKICFHCMSKLKYLTSPRCYTCGKKLLQEEEEFCYDCGKGNHKFINGRSLYEYECIALSIYKFKYGNRREYAMFYGEEIVRYLGDYIRGIHPDGLLPVPLHKSRKRKRGYNQASLLAREIGEQMGIPVYDKLVKRVKNTSPLKQLGSKERQNNLKKAFHIIGNDVKLSTIVIIDDIYTTGSTIDELADTLRSAGVKEIYFITLASGAGV
ncbi:ComF family protein [Lachnospiraceae bacterium OttesenSCG-928-D06]|nr:ComF family protein [Lachnospiraceae bacterium OttesenSCG-928-D06]